MEPILPEPINQNNQENPSAAQQVGEYSVAVPENSPNTAPERSKESSPGMASSAVAPALPVVPPPAPVPPVQSTSVSSDDIASLDPVIADDVDVIEKEWVDKAKKIVSATKEDPYTQEREVSKLQADYLSKRYNKNLKLAE